MIFILLLLLIYSYCYILLFPIDHMKGLLPYKMMKYKTHYMYVTDMITGLVHFTMPNTAAPEKYILYNIIGFDFLHSFLCYVFKYAHGSCACRQKHQLKRLTLLYFNNMFLCCTSYFNIF